MIPLTCGTQNMTQINLSNRIMNTENRLAVAKGEGVEGEEEQEAGINRCKLSYTEWVNKLYAISHNKP